MLSTVYPQHFSVMSWDCNQAFIGSARRRDAVLWLIKSTFCVSIQCYHVELCLTTWGLLE